MIVDGCWCGTTENIIVAAVHPKECPMCHNGVGIFSSFCENNSILFYVCLCVCVCESLMNMFNVYGGEEAHPKCELPLNEIKYNLILLCKLYKMRWKYGVFTQIS